MSSLEPLKHNHYQCFPAVGSYWLAGPSPQLHCCQTLSHAYVWWKLGWGLADLLCTYGLVLLEGCLGPLAWFIVKAGERLRERVWVPERGRRGGQQRAKRTAAWCMLGNRHAFTFLISWTSSYISTAAILQLIRIFGCGLLKGARLPTGVEGAVSLKRLSVHSHWYHTVNSKQRPLSLKEKKKKEEKRKKRKKRKKEKKVKFIYRDSKGNILFILYIYLLYRVYF